MANAQWYYCLQLQVLISQLPLRIDIVPIRIESGRQLVEMGLVKDESNDAGYRTRHLRAFTKHVLHVEC